MKKILLLLFLTSLVVCLAIPSVGSFALAEEKGYKSYYVMDYDSGTVIDEENSNDRHPIASMVKIMTLAIAFDEIEKGNLSFDEKITISDYAAGMGGSQMFLDRGEEYPVTDLIKGVIVCSANDAATALGERISGNIDAFVSKMNNYAKQIGMNDTLFCNATGLPNSGEQYSTAHDVSLMMQKVFSHPEYYNYSKIWMENYTHPDGRVTEMVNTNKLIRSMPECIGGKTGFTNEAGFCLSAGAQSGDTKIIATVLGGADSKARFRKVSELLKYGLSNYETKIFASANEKIPCKVDVTNGKTNEIWVKFSNDLKLFVKKSNKNDQLKIETTIYDNLSAPIEIGEAIGKIELKDENGNILSHADIITETKIEKMTFGDHLKRIIRNRFFIK